jgi:Tfp pilus assembly protein PilP
MSLDEGDEERARFVYDPTGKRDPFRKFDFRAVDPDDANRTEAERYDLGQLKLTGIIQGFEEPIATIENAGGKGMYLKKGDKIGLNKGEITEIKTDRIVIVETVVDFTGQKQSKTVEMRLRTKDQER